MSTTELELPVNEDVDLLARATGAVDPSEAIARKAPPQRELRKGDFASLPANMTPSGSDSRKLEPVSPAAFGNRVSTQATAAAQVPGQAVAQLPSRATTSPAIVADARKGSVSFSFVVDNQIQGRVAVPCIVVEGKRAYLRALPLEALGVRMETGRKFKVTITETEDSSPSLRRLGAGIVRV